MDNGADNYNRGFLFGTLLGGAIGALTALLLAPKSGAELRKDLADRGTYAYDKASRYISDLEIDLGSAVRSTMNEGKERAERIVNSAREQADSILENAERVLADAKSRANNIKDDVTGRVETVKDAARAGIDAFKDEMNQTT